MSEAEFRLPQGGVVNRSRPIRFSFNGKSYGGYVGDTLASALLANGVHMVARSFKYHRPRGILGAGSEDPAALVQVGNDPARTDPNTRATELAIYDGLETFAQNCWPSLDHDIGVFNDFLAPFLPAGFYYKTMMGPPGNWMFFEKFVRNAAGLGVCPSEPDPDRYEHANRHVEVLVIGGGAAGLVAALAAARSGARVILAEESDQLGGQLLSLDPDTNRVDGKLPADWVAGMVAALNDHPDVTVLTRTCASGYFADNFVTLHECNQDHLAPTERDPGKPRERLWRIRAKRVVLATGAIERPLVFHSNDRPGIMLAGAVRTYLHRYGVLVGKRAVVFCNNSSAWQTAFDLHKFGATIAAIVDTRQDPEDVLLKAARKLAIPVHAGATIVATEGRKRVSGAWVQKMAVDGGTLTGEPERLDCDLLAVSGGFSPNVALFSQSRGKLRYDDTLVGFRPAQSWQAEVSAGACNGTFSLADSLAEANAAGADAAGHAGFHTEQIDLPQLDLAVTPAYAVLPAWELPSGRSPGRTRAFHDFQNDVTAKDLHLAVREGYTSVEHAKRYTTTGMGTDQGKTSSVNAFGILSGLLDKPIPDIGVTTYRQPFKPVTFGAVAGPHVGKTFLPRRTTPMHDWHEAQNATFETVGDWLRARTYPIGKEAFHDAVQRESRQARDAIGILDASTLGKIDIRGKDAREFINRIYTNAWLKLKPGFCRYGLMLNEDGMVFDDGVTACITDNHFHMTTTTGGAAGVLGWLEEYHQTEWPDLEVYMTTVTEQWAVASVCGPQCDKLVSEICDHLDPNPENFPFMSWRDDSTDGVPIRVFRISFTGELSYEININASYGLWLWEKLMEAGAKYGITPYGTEAMHLLRAEKGFIIVGQDTDGTATPHDLRMDWCVKKNVDFVGRRSLSRTDTTRTDRRQLVGLVTHDPAVVLEEGAQIISTPDLPAPPVPMLGHVTSSYFSPNLDHSIALALISGGGARMGETLFATWKDDSPIPVRVVEPDFFATRENV